MNEGEYIMTEQKIFDQTFDIAWDCPLGDFLKTLEDFNLTLKSFIAEGPGGGNPCITVSGTPTNLSLFEFHIG